MKLICGLGNPEKKYLATRHNLGFMFIDAFADKQDFPAFKVQGKNLISEKGEGIKKVILIKPQTFMNLSGEAVREVLDYYKMDLKDLSLVYDDVDLPLGTLRFREKGSAGTHNGMKSVVENLGTGKFSRLRMGIESRGVTAAQTLSLYDFVLSHFLEEEQPIVKKMIEEAVMLLEGKISC